MIDLNDIKKDTVFKVPDNYFENLESKILDNVKKNNSKRITFNFSRRIVLGVASVAAVFALFFFVINNESDNYDLDLLAEYSSIESVEDYYLEYLDEEEISNFSTNTYSNEEVIEYLLEENIDYDLISENY